MQRHAFDNDWLFDLGDVGEASKTCHDASWRKLDLPHDWSIELPRRADAPGGLDGSGGFFEDGEHKIAHGGHPHIQIERAHQGFKHATNQRIAIPPTPFFLAFAEVNDWSHP